MEFFLSAIAWIFDPANYAAGSLSPLPIGDRIGEHLLYTLVAVLLASVVALPLGLFIGHTGRGRQFVIAFTGGMRALPTLGLLMALFVIIGMWAPFTITGVVASIVSLAVLAVPSTLAGAYSGVEAVDPVTVDAARANGMTEWQILTRVEVPLALPLIVGGLRASVLQVIATTVIASYIGLGGIGRIISSGIGLNDNDRILGGAILVTALALVVDGVFALVQRLLRGPGAVGAGRMRRERNISEQARVAV
ncbi:osmoprotectant transport system permease protein [Homoserinimonas aerilata]|uniref:Osmoprotectant transport system permease protein n=1 Tax=Homoserinimonas aerilata TaxID=1162970 RepID=A0A542YGW7_9MICO|nr:ABC transporter permease [Homoserinimonas aerilata]TQL47327.1 osmoprotectant transport system permease protein [Homoserinimonas aerilata]